MVGTRWLGVGAVLSLLLGLYVYAQFGLGAAVATVGVGLVATRLAIYLILERYLSQKRLKEFLAGKLRHRCVGTGRCCYLRVNLLPDDYKRILQHAKKRGLREEIIEKQGASYWLVRRRDGACVFLEKQPDGLLRCSIYSIRPTACRLYPLVPAGTSLRLDPTSCPNCFNREQGHDFIEFLKSQDVLLYVRKNWAGAKDLWPKE